MTTSLNCQCNIKFFEKFLFFLLSNTQRNWIKDLALSHEKKSFFLIFFLRIFHHSFIAITSITFGNNLFHLFSVLHYYIAFKHQGFAWLGKLLNGHIGQINYVNKLISGKILIRNDLYNFPSFSQLFIVVQICKMLSQSANQSYIRDLFVSFICKISSNMLLYKGAFEFIT